MFKMSRYFTEINSLFFGSKCLEYLITSNIPVFLNKSIFYLQ